MCRDERLVKVQQHSFKYLFHKDSSFRSCRTYIHDTLGPVSGGTGLPGEGRFTGSIQGDDVVALRSYNRNQGYRAGNKEIHTGATLVTPSPTDSTCFQSDGL